MDPQRKVGFSALLIIFWCTPSFGRTFMGTAKPDPCDVIVCTGEHRHVCGSDGVTYVNGCYLKKASCYDSSIYKVRDGSCAIASNLVRKRRQATTLEDASPTSTSSTWSTPGSICGFGSDCHDEDGDHVCGSDGITYAGPCNFNYLNQNRPDIHINHTGSCSTEHCEINCPGGIIDPVCGSDAVTYKNDCEISAVRACNFPCLVTIFRGSCDPDSYPTTTTTTTTIPTTTTTTAPNPCDEMFCFEIWDPVCGSNGVTYGNDCKLEVAQCYDPSIIKDNHGPCGSTTPEPCHEIVCTEEYRPVCGSDGVTYDNECFLEKASCYDPSVYKVCDGPCGMERKNKELSINVMVDIVV